MFPIPGLSTAGSSLGQIRERIYFLVFHGEKRSVQAKRNILTGLVIKGASILVSLLLVSMTIHYVNPSGYGIWLTLSSVVGWFSFFDIGLTQGLRNKIAKAKANNEEEVVQEYISTAYALLGGIFLMVWVVLALASRFIDWPYLLHIPAAMSRETQVLFFIVFTYFCLQFVLRIITTILIADQEPAQSALIDFLGQLLSFCCIFFLVKTTDGSLLKLGLALCLAPLAVLSGANAVLFNGKYRRYRPLWRKVKWIHARGLFQLGVVFFLIQIAAIIQFQTANILIARHFGTAEVTSYNIVFKYFGILAMVFSIFLTPFWSASTEAFEKGEFHWIRNAVKKYNLLNLLLAVGGAVMLLLSGWVYDLWLGKDAVEISFGLSVWGFLFFNVVMFGSKYVDFLNGISALRIQLYASLASPLVYIALALGLIHYTNLGVSSLFIASIVSNINAFLIAPIQYYQVVYRKKRGIWVL